MDANAVKAGLSLSLADAGAEIKIYGAIGDIYDGITDRMFSAALEEVGNADKLKVRINSPGGYSHEGMAMANLLDDFDGYKTVQVDGIAYSAATLLLLPADHVIMRSGSSIMVHNPWMMVIGDYNDMARAHRDLHNSRQSVASLYAAKTGNNIDDVLEWMEEETTMYATEAVEKGFADEILETKAAETAEMRSQYVAMQRAQGMRPSLEKLRESRINVAKAKLALLVGMHRS